MKWLIVANICRTTPPPTTKYCGFNMYGTRIYCVEAIDKIFFFNLKLCTYLIYYCNFFIFLFFFLPYFMIFFYRKYRFATLYWVHFSILEPKIKLLYHYNYVNVEYNFNKHYFFCIYDWNPAVNLMSDIFHMTA